MPRRRTRPRLTSEATGMKGISRNTLLLGLVSFFNDISADMIGPLVPVFLRTVMGASMPVIGVIEGLAQFTASVLKPASGWLSDKTGRRKPIIFAGYWLATCTRPLMSVCGSAWHVLVLKFTDRVGKGVRTAPRDALIAESTAPGYWGKAFGFQRALDNLGAAVGLLAAAMLLMSVTTDIRVVFWLASIPGLVAVGLVLWGLRERGSAEGPSRGAEDSKQDDMRGRTAAAGTSRAFPPALRKWYAIVFVFWLGNSADAFLILKARSLGVPIWQLPLLMFVMNIVRALGATHGGELSDRLGRRGVILCGWLLYVLVYVGFAFARSAEAMYILFGAYGLYYAVTEGAERALVVDLSPQEGRATALGFYHLAVGAAALPASVMCGLLWQWERLGQHGPAVALGFGAACALLASLLLLVWGPRSAKAEERL